MFLTYNGVDLSIEHVLLYEKRAVYDPSGVDYLYTHHRLVVRAVWNPSATSNVGQVAALSITNLESTLMAPRKLLRLDVPNSGGAVNNVLFSPLLDPLEQQYPCDANNGPKPISFNVVSIVGQKTMICDFAIETWVKDCDSNRPIISHRWEMAHNIDQDFLTTRTISGLAIFRTDWLNQVGVSPTSPDQYRGWLFHPIRDNFQRTVQVQLSADNTSLRYVITDVEQVYNILPPYRAIIRADVGYSEFTGQMDVNWTGLGPATAAARRGGATGAFAAAVIAASSIRFPKTRFQLNIRLWGRRWCSIDTFRSAIASIAASMNFGPQVIFGVTLPRTFFQTSYEFFSLTWSYYESSFVAEVSAAASALQKTLGIGPASASFTPNSVFTYADGQTSNIGLIPNQSPNTVYGNRETMQLLIAQLFSEPCALPSRPPQNIANQQVLPLGNPTIQV